MTRTLNELRRWISLTALMAVVGWFCVSICIDLTYAQESATSSQTDERIQKLTYDFKEAGLEMEYALYVPTSYDRSSPSPLIVALHGLGSNSAQIIRYAGFTDLAEEHGYIVVAPMGYNSRGWYGSRGTGQAPSRRRGRGGAAAQSDPENLGELSEKDVMNVLELIQESYEIDEDRIYLLGHSMGGGGTWHIGTKFPTIWAGLAPIAPAIYSSADALEKITHIAVIVVQGDNDNLVPVEGARRWVAKMKELGMVYEYLEIAGGDHVTVAWDNLPAIFDFFNGHMRRSPAAH